MNIIFKLLITFMLVFSLTLCDVPAYALENVKPESWDEVQDALDQAGAETTIDLSELSTPASARVFQVGSGKNLTLKMAENQAQIKNLAFVFDNSNTITIDRLNIQSANGISTEGSFQGYSTLHFVGSGNTLNVTGVNTISSGQTDQIVNYGAAVGVSEYGNLTIKPSSSPVTPCLNAFGGAHGAGIGGGFNSNFGNITVNSLTVVANGGLWAAGVGGGSAGGGQSITIGNGAKITATGGECGAGIGGGRNNTDVSIHISGEHTRIIATGGAEAAGIGGGAGVNGGNGGTITIDSGIINTVGGYGSSDYSGGAGIGGGAGGDGGIITIAGGTVKSTGGKGLYSPGEPPKNSVFGGGAFGNGGKITISGGSVTTYGPLAPLGVNGGGGAGIGGGLQGNGIDVTVDGGSLHSTAGNTTSSGHLPLKNIGGGTDSSDDGHLSGPDNSSVYLNSLTVPGQRNVLISNCLYGASIPYDTTGVLTDDYGRVYFYLPASSAEEFIGLKADSKAYEGQYTRKPDDTNSYVLGQRISDFTVQVFPADGLTYTGTAQHPASVIVKSGTTVLSEGVDYTLSYSGDQINVSHNNIYPKVIVTGKGKYGGKAEQSYAICKAPLTLNPTATVISPKTYDGTAAAAVQAVGFDGLKNNETLNAGIDFTIDGASFDSASAGQNKKVRINLQPKDTSQVAKNYALGYLTIEGQSIAKSAAPAVCPQSLQIQGQTATTNNSFDLDALLPYDKGTTSYSIISGNPTCLANANIAAGRFTFDTPAISDPVSETVSIEAIMENYETVTLGLTVELVTKKLLAVTPSVQGVLSFGQPLSALSITCSAESEGNPVPGRISWQNPASKPVAGSSSHGWVFIPDNQTEFASATGLCVISVNKTQPRGTAIASSITQPGRTLADSMLSASFTNPYDNSCVSGAIAWNLDPTTKVELGKAYEWTFSPDQGSNHLPVSGFLKPYSSSGGGGTTPSPPPEFAICIIPLEGADIRVTPQSAAAGKEIVVTVEVTDSKKELSAILVDDRAIGGNTFTMPSQSAYLVDEEEGQSVGSAIEVSPEDNSILLVHLPSDRYIEGKSYNLYIQKIRSLTGKQLKTPVKVRLNIIGALKEAQQEPVTQTAASERFAVSEEAVPRKEPFAPTKDLLIPGKHSSPQTQGMELLLEEMEWE